jgi:hypothetical protein
MTGILALTHGRASRRRTQVRLGSASREKAMTLAEISLGTFSAFSGLRLVSYLPQIYRVARDANGASAISYSTWLLWTGSNLSTGFYAAINLGDRLLAACSSLYALCCVVVIVMTAIKRRRYSWRAITPERLPRSGTAC